MHLGLTDEEADMIKRESKHSFAVKGNTFTTLDSGSISPEEISATLKLYIYISSTFLSKLKDIYP